MDGDLAGAACDAMEQCTGARPSYRRAHARGLVCHATFAAAPDIKPLTIAEHLQGGPVAALGRFSNAAGSPYAQDRALEKVFDPSSFGYRKGRKTADALTKI
jgi:catalase